MRLAVAIAVFCLGLPHHLRAGDPAPVADSTPDNPADPLVWVNDGGTFYHAKGCKLILPDASPRPLSEVPADIHPCSDCRPPTLEGRSVVTKPAVVVDGFKGAKWGDTKAVAKGLFPKATEKDSDTLLLEDIEVGGEKAAAFLSFHEGQFYQAEAQFPELGTGAIGRKVSSYNRLQAALVDKYGPGSGLGCKNKSSLDLEGGLSLAKAMCSHEWSGPSWTITHFLFNNGDAVVHGLAYQNDETAAAAKAKKAAAAKKDL